MRAAFRTTVPALLSSTTAVSVAASASAARLPHPLLLCRRGSALLPFPPRRFSSAPPPSAPNPPQAASAASVVAMALDPAFATPGSSMEKQFEDFRVRLDESGGVRERIRAVVMEMEAAVRLMHSNILLVHHSRSNPEVLEKARVQIEVLKGLFSKLSEILQCSGQYYRYHGDWRSEAQSAVSLIAFLHWLESGNLLLHAEAANKLGLDASEFGLDIEDYLIGLCFMSNELPRYVVNQVTAGDYDCPRKVLSFLTDLHAAFRMLNLRNDFLRKKFDGMKYDVRRVEEVYYDVKIRGLASDNAKQEQNLA